MADHGAVALLDLYLRLSAPWMYWLFYLAVAWPLAWLGHAWLARRFPDRVDRHWPWHRLVGATLVLWPFVRHLYGVWVDFAFVLDTDSVAGTTPAWLWWRSIERRWWQYVLVPLVGMFLALGPVGRAGAAASLRARLRATFESVSWWPKRSWGHDLAVGFGLFFVVYVGYYWLNRLLAPLRRFDTGDESAVFDGLTPGLAFALALTAGVTEELVFRGVLQGRLRLFVPTWAAVTIQSVFFGLIHAGYGTIGHMVFPMFFGAAMGVVVLRWGLMPAIWVHALIDLVIFLSIVGGLGHTWTWTVIPFVFLAGILLPAAYFLSERLRRPEVATLK